ncbi:hypothetical protein GGS26DRAFT_586254 [Hypomontagnella submonticulosa]|nr:hypothetical protein GGS26DRAFT_586254 [Hypomontagnella submonticulosa]
MLAPRFAMTVRSSAGAVSRGRIASPYRLANGSYSPKPSTQITTSKFSTSYSRLTTKEPKKDSSKSPEDPIPMGSIFKDLAISRTAKIVILIALSIYGTMETIFYYNWFRRWWSGDEDNQSRSKA